MHLIRQAGVAQPPASAIAGVDMDTYLSGNAPRRAGEAEQKSREYPMHQRALATIQQRTSEIIEGALAGLLFTAVAFQPWLVVVRPPRTDVVALTAGTLEGALFPPQRMDIGLTRCGVEEVVEMRHHRHR